MLVDVVAAAVLVRATEGECEDEEGRWWSIEGESSWSTSSFVDEEEEEQEGPYGYEERDDENEYDDDGYDNEEQDPW